MDDRGRPILSGLVSRDAGSFNDGGVQVGASQGGGPASMPSIVAGSPTPRGARLGAASVKEPASRDTSAPTPPRTPCTRTVLPVTGPSANTARFAVIPGMPRQAPISSVT